MHDTALDLGRLFFERHCDGVSRCLDVGSMDVNGSLREVCPSRIHYTGVDLEPGPGVDVVMVDSTRLPFEDGAFDAVVSTSALEHDPLFWVTFLEMLRVLGPEGTLYLNVPSNGHYHRHPHDCWRFYPDSGEALIRWALMSAVDCHLVESFTASRKQAEWNDQVIVIRKGPFVRVPELFMSDGVQNFTNARKVGLTGLIRFCEFTEDQRLIEHFYRLSERPA